MRHFLLLLLLASGIVASSCKKDNTQVIFKDPNSLEDAKLLSSGSVSFFDERNNEGLARIYQRKDGVYVLGLEQMNYQSMFDKNIYLSSTPQLMSTSIKISSAKKLHGNNYYPMTSGINIPAFKYLIIQGDTDSEPVATAFLQ